jgi:hypothetical protein
VRNWQEKGGTTGTGQKTGKSIERKKGLRQEADDA